MVDTTTATAPIRSVTQNAPRSSSFESSRGYHSSVNPFQATPRGASLNENRIRITTGAKRNA